MSFCVIDKVSPKEFEAFAFRHLPEGDFKHILLKPNWVMHQQNPAFPISALVTDSGLIDAVLKACLSKYPLAQSITIGDVPLQSCDWNLLLQQTGVDELVKRYGGYSRPKILFRDLRRERFAIRSGFMVRSEATDFGDPQGYSEIVLDYASFLEDISQASSRFRVSDYNPQETVSSHRKGFHRYLLAKSALNCDLFINVPKMKTHQKAGITGALKNLVGVNGNKAFLVHHRSGLSGSGGDEFPPDIAKLLILQSRLRQNLHDHSRLAFSLLRPFWHLIRKIAGIQVEGTRENLKQKFYIGSGSWYGNDTVWRMIYDLNRIIRYGTPDSEQLKDEPQREYIAILDGMVAGEGNGPLQPLPVPLGCLIVADDPFLMDTVMAALMGFDPEKIPMLAHRTDFLDPAWGNFDSDSVKVELQGRMVKGIASLPVLHGFQPAPGWRDHIELAPSMAFS